MGHRNEKKLIQYDYKATALQNFPFSTRIKLFQSPIESERALGRLRFPQIRIRTHFGTLLC